MRRVAREVITIIRKEWVGRDGELNIVGVKVGEPCERELDSVEAGIRHPKHHDPALVLPVRRTCAKFAGGSARTVVEKSLQIAVGSVHAWLTCPAIVVLGEAGKI